jgi:4-hydroxy-3-methylbut-2-enyl diphosphate reductase
MAVKALTQMVRVFEPPVYCYHEIVHNRLIVDRFRAAGVVFVDDVEDVPLGAPLMLSAHGSGPDVTAAADERAGFVVNAVCPLVAKVHHEARTRAAKGYTIFYAGHRGHDEAEGLVAVAPDAIRLVEHEADFAAAADSVRDGSPVAVLAQTTLAVSDWKGLVDSAATRFPGLWQASRSDLCFATTNRQQAIAAVAPRVDAIVVIGSANSSNTQALVKVALAAGCARVQRVDTADELDVDQLADVRVAGVTAGASAPEEMVDAVIGRLAPSRGVEVVEVTDEDEYFPPPRELRQLARAVTALLAPGPGPAGDDPPEPAVP